MMQDFAKGQKGPEESVTKTESLPIGTGEKLHFQKTGVCYDRNYRSHGSRSGKN